MMTMRAPRDDSLDCGRFCLLQVKLDALQLAYSRTVFAWDIDYYMYY